MNKVYIEDYQRVGELEFIDWNQFRDCSILITGSTGLIGSNLVNTIAFNSEKKRLNIKLILPVRNVALAEKMFKGTGTKIIHYELGTTLKINIPVDYIVHLASPTSSSYFKDKPVNTIMENVEGTRALLDWAKEHHIKKFVYVSTMEVYGFPEKGHKVTEDELGNFETMNARNSYPLSKIVCECLCNAYRIQYNVQTVVLRATQTFGPGVKYDDGRVFAELMRCAIEKKDIVLKTAGKTERSYLYTADAISALLVCLLKAEPGQAYTAANPETYCSIRDMAEMVANEIAKGAIKVVQDIAEDNNKLGYADTLYMDLNINKLNELGWKPGVNLRSMFERMIEGITNEE